MLRTSQAWSAPSFPEVVVFAHGRVPVLEGERFVGAVGRLLERLHVTGGARLRITGPEDENGPLLVQVNLHVGDTSVRIQTPTHGRGDALPVVLRLEHQITALREPWAPRPWPDPTRPALDAAGPGELTRRKPVELVTVGPHEAAAVMDARDYDVHLFTDADTGEDAVVHRAGPSGLRLARQRSMHPPSWAADRPGPFTLTPRPAPVLTESDAVSRVCGHGLPFLFYTDPDTGRGQLLYRRYDTGLSLLTPAGTRQ